MKHFAAKTLSVLLALSMVIALIPAEVRADESPWQVGIVNYYSTGSPENIISDSYYYTDEWFLEDPASRNDALALVSMQLTAAAVDDRADGLGPAFLNELGFNETGYVCSDPGDPAGCNYTWGRKTISDGDETFQLVAIQIQSYSFDQNVKDIGWAQNFYVNGEILTDTHFGLTQAAAGALPSIAALGDAANVKFWVTGQSRGGAIADLIATALGGAGNTVYAYTFESPAVVEGYAAEECSYIHNYLCTDDIVTMVPPWGMTRNGDVFILNTEESNAALEDELQKMGSTMAESVEDYLAASPETDGINLMNALTSGIPSREAYSAENVDAFADEEGNEIEITYVYQDLFLKLVRIIFGGGISGIDTGLFLDKVSELTPFTGALARGVKEDSLLDYYRAAEGLYEFLPSVGIQLPLSVEDLYVLLRLAGPVLIDASYETENDPLELEDMIMYLSPGITLFGSAKNLVFSHHFDTLIARLKTLAPSPVFDELNILIGDPAAGDDADAAPSEIRDFVDASGLTFIEVSSKWESEDEVLKDGRVYYLSAELRCTGYAVPDDFSVTLNGAEPVKAPSVSYEGGVYTIRAKWAFTLGVPLKVRVSYETGEITADPEPVLVDAGSQLGYVLTPDSFGRVVSEEGTWQHDGWFDENGQNWEDVVADQDLTLYAKWTALIDKINITYRIPRVGEALGEPLAEENAKYVIEDIWFVNSKWEDVTTAEDTEPVSLSFYVRLASENDRFPFYWDDDDMPIYDGTVTMNGESGESLTVDYNEVSSHVIVYYTFNPLPAEDTPTPTPAEDTPTPTPAEDTPTPTPAEDTPTPIPADSTLTPTPTEKATPTPTVKATPTPTGRAAVPTPTGTTPSSSRTITTTSTEVIRTVSDGDGKAASTAGNTVRTTSVKTGDENSPVLWLLLMAAGFLTAVSVRKKSGRKTFAEK